MRRTLHDEKGGGLNVLMPNLDDRSMTSSLLSGRPNESFELLVRGGPAASPSSLLNINNNNLQFKNGRILKANSVLDEF